MSTISKIKFKEYIESFNFTNLFNDLGWNHLNEQTPIKLNEETYTFHSVAEKSGFRIMVFNPNASQDLPDYATRLQLDRKIGKLFREHLLIFCDKNNTTQIWQLFVKQLGKPSRLSETRWLKGQEPELLYQKTSNLFFTLDEEENITIADVVDVINENFSKNVEQVTKKFYENFRKEHKKFLEFIQGISEITNREWYASLMLNRLMFCYFIQKKGFLDNNLNYLKEKLTYCQQKKGKNKFYVSFYKNFLLALFHQGLGSPDQPEEIKKEIGRIPYLNGGLFDVHELEKQHTTINISDEAFENIFHFFDQYNWHLDTRIAASGKDINPDVIGFIFEKYINDRAQMGAYYTKEDITDYISKNCIIPFLFDETERRYPKAFKSSGTLSEVEVWQMLKESGDTYIYEAIKKGVDLPLPKEIEIGMDTSKPNLIERRKEWNKSAPSEYALPTEIWREVVDRRKRYTEIRDKIDKGEITHINDFITYNLNIRQFTQDVIDNHSDPVFIRHFFNALSAITILDPTCGSGAFLFAAMNILEPLYESCIMRMRSFVEDEDFINNQNKQSFCHKYNDFRETLKYIQGSNHPNQTYFIYKSIILKNLYGVDIMKEAVEIAKLRLFLKMVATVDVDYNKPNLGLEPLPDIDFNIRAGNTLVGLASLNEVIQAVKDKDNNGQIGLVFEEELDIVNAIKNKADDLARVFKSFKNAQLQENIADRKNAKDRLLKYQSDLNDILNEYLAFTYHIDKIEQKDKYKQFLLSHQPFHWLAEFYEIIQDKGGFDVVIGNPPYVEYSTVKKFYTLKDFDCLSSGNLYSFIIERAIKIQKENSYNGMIIPLSAYCTDRMASFQRVIFEHCSELFLSYYAERPSKLFEGAERNLVISVFKKNGKRTIEKIFTTYYYKWNSAFRDFLFENISYTESKATIITGIVPKISTDEELSIIKNLRKVDKNIGCYASTSKTNHYLYYRNSGGRYWKIITDFQPKFYLNGKRGVSSRESYLFFNDIKTLKIIIALLNSSTFYWYYIMHSDARTNNPSDLKEFPIEIENISDNLKEKLIIECEKFMKDLDNNSIMQPAKYKTGDVEFQQFFPQKSKSIIDEIDTVLAEYYSFTEEELDFIINYDIKYRMGKDLDNGEEEE
jgi:hypothetical protein